MKRPIERLADRIVAGEAVFFIGAGLSLDSEGHATAPLMLRLLLRFEAMASAMAAPGAPLEPAASGPRHNPAQDLRRSLRQMFLAGLTPSVPAGAAPGDTTLPSLFDERLGQRLDRMGSHYYAVNDWMCSAFDELLGAVPDDAAARTRLAEQVARHERTLLDGLARASSKAYNWPPPWPPQLGPLDLTLLWELHRHCRSYGSGRPERSIAGKALMLDTLGMADPRLWRGAPLVADPAVAEQRVDGLLKPRHHALARLAAEGLCPTLVTTNFDLLLESALRQTGLEPSPKPEDDVDAATLGATPAGKPARVLEPAETARFTQLARITDAAQFFDHAQSQQAVQLFKIHGCAGTYRHAREAARRSPREATSVRDDTRLAFEAWRSLLPTIVFTFREIQNWRDDTWSRDHLNTLLRTKTVVFAGYSTADPVIHDTFRTIYEEMARFRQAAPHRQPPPAPGPAGDATAAAAVERSPPPGESAPAFVLAPQAEFHGLEILRAASAASGVARPPLASHPNLINFEIGGFPDIDTLLVAVYHLCARELQRRALAVNLRQVYYQLMGHHCPQGEANALLHQFATLLEAETEELVTMLSAPAPADPAARAEARRHFGRLTAWTWHFQHLLRREYAIASTLQRDPMAAAQMAEAARRPGYSPISASGLSSAWGAVLEMALRRAGTALVQGAPGDSPPSAAASPGTPPAEDRSRWPAWCRAAAVLPLAHSAPAVAISAGACGLQRVLTIEVAGMNDLLHRPLPRSVRVEPPWRWMLRPHTVPWWQSADGLRPGRTPPPDVLWRWAALPATLWSDETPSRYFGMQGAAAARPTTNTQPA